MNLVQSINNAMDIALKTDPTASKMNGLGTSSDIGNKTIRTLHYFVLVLKLNFKQQNSRLVHIKSLAQIQHN